LFSGKKTKNAIIKERLMDPLTDEACAAQVKKGDHDAFGVLVDRYEEKLMRYGRKFLSERRDIEDIVQEVFVSAYRNIQSFDEAQRFSPWIYRIAHNAFIDQLKKNTRNPFVLVDFDTFVAHGGYDESVKNDYDQKEMKEMINKGLAQLSPKYREALILYYLEDLSYKEIAEVLRVPLGTVSARVKRAKGELKKNIIL
jgi:RNA polymerase sigma-70 factor (ECF subfamily)